MGKSKNSACLFCSQKFTTEKMNQVHCSMKCRLLTYIEKLENGCWEWKGSKDKDGYGLISIGNKSRRVHRISYETFKEESIPFDQNACHSCDNPSCINPEHIFLGKSYENTQDMMNKGRSRFSRKGKVLNEEKVKMIRKMHELGLNNHEIARAFEITPPHVDHILKEKIWKHIL